MGGSIIDRKLPLPAIADEVARLANGYGIKRARISAFSARSISVIALGAVSKADLFPRRGKIIWLIGFWNGYRTDQRACD